MAAHNGVAPIESIVEGQYVWAYDLIASEWQLRRALRTYSRPCEGLAASVTVAGETIVSTSRHPYFVTRGEALDGRPRLGHLAEVPKGATTAGRWVDAADLCAGDEVVLLDGRVERIEDVRLYPFTDTVYNFEVDDLHCYAVGRSGVLVHNNNGPEIPPPDQPPPQANAPEAEAAGNQTLRDILTPAEQAEFEALRAKHPDWMPEDGLDTPAEVRTVAENAEARAQFTGRGHHRQPLKFGGEPNPPDLVPTGDTRTVKNPIHIDVTNWWNKVLRRINSQ